MKPILFSTAMVQAILAGTKTQTRRTVKLIDFMHSTTKGYDWEFRDKRALWNSVSHDRLLELCPYGKTGDILWVRETFSVHEDSVQGSYAYSEGEPVKYPPHFLDKKGVKRCIDFKADYPKASLKWKQSIFMPREACRLFLEVTNIRVERLQDISEQDAIAEGVETLGFYPGYNVSSYGKYEGLWSKINGHDSWDKNPFVWVVEFKRVNQ